MIKTAHFGSITAKSRGTPAGYLLRLKILLKRFNNDCVFPEWFIPKRNFFKKILGKMNSFGKPFSSL
jgi:hypothetical protein